MNYEIKFRNAYEFGSRETLLKHIKRKYCEKVPLVIVDTTNTVATKQDIIDTEKEKVDNNHPITVLDHTSESSKHLLQVRERVFRA